MWCPGGFPAALGCPGQSKVGLKVGLGQVGGRQLGQALAEGHRQTNVFQGREHIWVPGNCVYFPWGSLCTSEGLEVGGGHTELCPKP